MNSFGLYFFEMKFGWNYFKIPELKKTHFGTYLKEIIYKTSKSLGYEIKDWKLQKNREKANTLVNKMLDINYLFRRLSYL